MEHPRTPAPTGPPSSAKRTIRTFLKRSPDASLADIAAALGVSRTGALKHRTRLESDGLVARRYRPSRIGRPPACFHLTDTAQQIFPAGTTQAALSAIRFIERREGRAAVTEMLEERADELRARHAPRLAGRELPDRVRELGRIRDEEGYMAEVRRSRGGETELLEHNCPILAIAERYGEAGDVERRLFRRLLGADVRVSHRAVAGDPVGRFLVRARSDPGPIGEGRK
ncbi:MAG: helix-turn-helix transcriptional regulator [Thermoplasmata archaeon]